MTSVQTDKDQLFVGYGPASEYLGIAKGTLSTYVGRGQGPRPEKDRVQAGQYNHYVFRKSELDRWKANKRPGMRTDRQHAGFDHWCGPCSGLCKVDIPT